MPTLDKRGTHPRWKGVVTFKGDRKEKRFQDDSEKSKRAAIVWEEQTRKQMEAAETVQQITPKTAGASATLIEWANSYLDHCKATLSPRTMEEKLASFKRLIKMHGKHLLIEELDDPKVYHFLQNEFKNRSGYAANRVRKNLSAAWKWGRKHVTGFPKQAENPFHEADRMPEQRSPRYVPPEDDFWKVYSLAQGQDKVLLLTFLHLGARKGEIFNLKVEDLDLSNKTVTLWTSKREGGNREHDLVPLTTKLQDILKNWLETRPVKSDYVFVNLSEYNYACDFYGKPFVARQHWLKKLCKKAEVKEFTYHSIRHLTASILYQGGQKIPVIQRFLRHKSPQTTTRYLQRIGVKETREALDSVMDGRGPLN